MVRRQGDPNPQPQTLGGYFDSIITQRQSEVRSKGPDQLINRHRVESWLSSLPLTEPLRAKEAAFGLLLEQDSLRLPFSVERTDALFHLDRGIIPSLIKLESDYLAAKAGGELEQVLWRACSELGRAFIVTYERAFSENLERLGSRAALQSLTLILVRIIHYLAWQARLAVYQRTDWIPGRWQQLHRIYRKAKAFGVQMHEIPDLSDPARQRKTGVESEYVSLLLMWRLNSGTLSRTEVAQAYYWLRDRPRHMQFVPTSRPGTRLGVDPTQPDGMKPAAHLAGAAERLLFDSTVLAEPLIGTQARLEERLRSAPNALEGRRLRQQIELVNYLITHWAVNGFTERAQRTAMDRRVEVVAGWPAIAAYLRSLNKLSAVLQPAPAPIRASIAARPESSIQRSWAAEEPATGRGKGLWIVREESASGCRVVSPANSGSSVRVGEAVAMHDPLSGQYDVALVRRWKMSGEDRIEIGMMWLGRNARPLVLHPAATATGAPAAAKIMHVIGGEMQGASGELLLALVPAAATSDLTQLWERAATHGKSVLCIEAVELPGSDWSWVRLRVVANEEGVPGERTGPIADEITEIEITAPRE